MRTAFLVFAAASCISQADDVRTEITSATLTVTNGRMSGTVDVHFESLASEPLVLSDLSLQLVSAKRIVGALDVALPADVGTTFEPGVERDVTFTIDDDGEWSSFCGTVEIQLNHHATEPSGKTITSLGADRTVDVACP